jgi:hypothetical protein
MIYPWLGKWAPGVRYETNDIVEHDAVRYICLQTQISSWATNEPGLDIPFNVWEEIVKKHAAQKDPFYYEPRDEEYTILLDESDKQTMLVKEHVPDDMTASQLTTRLNNAIYRWLAREVN